MFTLLYLPWNPPKLCKENNFELRYVCESTQIVYANRLNVGDSNCRRNDFDVCESTKVVSAKRPQCMRIDLYAKRPTSGEACHGQKTGSITKTCDEPVSIWAGHVSSPLWWIFFYFFPFNRRRLLYFVFSALDFGEFKCFVLYVNEHDFESPWLWEQLYFDCIY